ncbi:MAG: bifunctional precorrin-2 dehydrogenase/sirohydrochlorin ferrochelatase [Syntrophomonas sp.]|nr:bifunctional precorrin-2 dehydrogenase/sirohydrochlorin ferrochelatase [Syntrophomonas sp.]
MEHLYPIYINLAGKKCLVVGGGKVAQRKIETLLEYKARVQVASPVVTDPIDVWAQSNLISWAERNFEPADLADVFLVFIATGDKQTNKEIASLCRDRGIMVNAVDDPENCDFFVPAILRRESLCIAVSTEGKSPLLAAKLRNELESLIPSAYGDWVETLGRLRDEIKHADLDIKKRQQLFAELVNSDILELIIQGRKQQAEERINECMSCLRV